MDTPQAPTIVYDGECPFCSNYVRLLRLREALGPVRLVNARDGGPLVADLIERGLDLDEGMVLMLDGEIFHGQECINRLALLSTDSNFFNRLNARVFRSPTAARLLYPVLRAGRNATLRLLGRRRIQERRPPRLPHSRYRSLVWLLVAGLVVYATIGEARRLPVLRNLPGAQTAEVFPFFNWSLFSRSPRFMKRRSVEVVSADPNSDAFHLVGRILTIDDAPFLRDIRFQKASGNYRRLLLTGNTVAIEAAQRTLDNYVRPLGIREYRIVAITIDPLAADLPASVEAITDILRSAEL